MRERILPTRLLLLVVLLAGCKVDGTLTIRVDDDGSGAVVASVQLDAEAVERLERYGGGSLDERIRLDDLLDAGWTTAGWRTPSDGTARLTLRHRFRGPREAERLVDELVGTTGLYRDATVLVERGAFSERTEVSLTADLSDLGVDVADDRETAARLTALGVDPAAVDLVLTGQAHEALTLTAAVATAGRQDRATASVGEHATAQVVVEETRTAHVALAVVAGVAALAGIALLVTVGVSLWRARRGRRGRTDAPASTA